MRAARGAHGEESLRSPHRPRRVSLEQKVEVYTPANTKAVIPARSIETAMAARKRDMTFPKA